MEKDDSFWLNVAYVVLAACLIYVYWLSIEMIGVQTNWIVKYADWFNPVKNILPIALGAGTVFILRFDSEKHQYYLESITELRKVIWPTGPDTRRMTLVVCWVVGIFGVILFFFDSLWSYLLKLVLT
jgi:preprotein translocase subunit SecE